MRKGILLGGVLLQVAFAYQDSDLDGVDDSVDKCPNTPILELVDRFGCPIEEKRKGTLYLRFGGGLLKDEDESRTFSLFSVAYSVEHLYLSFSTRYYLSSELYDPGMGDSSLFAGYSRFLTDKVYTLTGVRLKIPTGSDSYSSGEFDLTPSVLIDYLLGRFDLFGYLSYTFRGSSYLKDTFSLSVGGGYDLTEKLYTSLSYDVAQSATRGDSISSLSLFLLYDINRYLYTTLSYSKGLDSDAIDHSLTFRVGVRF